MHGEQNTPRSRWGGVPPSRVPVCPRAGEEGAALPSQRPSAARTSASAPRCRGPPPPSYWSPAGAHANTARPPPPPRRARRPPRGHSPPATASPTTSPPAATPQTGTRRQDGVARISAAGKAAAFPASRHGTRAPQRGPAVAFSFFPSPSPAAPSPAPIYVGGGRSLVAVVALGLPGRAHRCGWVTRSLCRLPAGAAPSASGRSRLGRPGLVVLCRRRAARRGRAGTTCTIGLCGCRGGACL